MNRKMIWIGMIVGSTVGGAIPGLWHASMFSFASMILSAIGGLAGIWLGYRLGR